MKIHSVDLAQIGRNIKGEMRRQDKTQADLRAVLGLRSQSNVSDRLSGDTAFRLDEILVVAAWLDVPLSRFLEDVELPHLDSNQEPAGYLPSVYEFYHGGPKSGVNLPPVPADRTTPKAA